MAERSTIWIGDVTNIVATLKEGGVAVAVESSDTVKAVLARRTGETYQALLTPIVVDLFATGSDLPNGVVVVEFTAGAMASVSEGAAHLLIRNQTLNRTYLGSMPYVVRRSGITW